jgi:hypothetical protein
MPWCHHLANHHRHRQFHRTNIAASPTAASKEEIVSVVGAQRCMHWEGEKFDVVMKATTKMAAVAAATAMRWGGQTSR